MKQSIICLSFVLAMACSSVDKETDKQPVDVHSVKTEAGFISGTLCEDSIVKVFRGIPFAAAPIGNLRWKPPIPVQPWQGVRKCEVFSASAMQNKPAPYMMWTKEFQAPEEPLSEDCLYLNIWTKAKTSDEKLPVMVWIHGGAFTGGSGSVPLYNGEEMAKKGVVFITINYRLGVFGFLAHPELTKESPDSVSGNYGILDQIAALKWIRKNVSAFGGDTTRITIAGQSAGAFSVNILMTSPLTKGLFHRAIAHSGGMFEANIGKFNSLDNAEKNGQKFSDNLKTKSIEQLRSLSADELMKAGGSFGVAVDSFVVFPAYEAFTLSKHNDVPLLTGWNAHEFYFGQPLNANDYKRELKARYGVFSDGFLKAFPAGSDEEAAKSQKLFSFLSFGWQNYCWASLQSKFGKNKSYLFYFNHVPPGLPDYGAFHSAEFGYVLKTLKYWDKPFTEYDYQLAENMSSYWVNFVASGDPNGEGLPFWPAFNNSDRRVMELGDSIRAIDLPFRLQLEFIDRYQESLRNGK